MAPAYNETIRGFIGERMIFTEIWCGLLIAPAYNETIPGLIGEWMISGPPSRDTSFSHSLMSASPRCGLIVQYPSFLIFGIWMRADHRIHLGTRCGACFQDA